MNPAKSVSDRSENTQSPIIHERKRLGPVINYIYLYLWYGFVGELIKWDTTNYRFYHVTENHKYTFVNPRSGIYGTRVKKLYTGQSEATGNGDVYQRWEYVLEL
jgi:hypothetical protein